MPGHWSEVLITLAVAWIYITIVRFVDVNEREPVWSLALAFGFGLGAATLLPLLVESSTLVLTVWPGAAFVESAKFLAIGATTLAFAGIARTRGWSELTDLVDGMVYGITVGLGFSTGEILAQQLAASHSTIIPMLQSPGRAIVGSALGGLSGGVFGAIIGLGFGAAVERRTLGGWLTLPLVGLALGIGADGLFRILAHGNALGGQAGATRAWLAVVIPMVMMVLIGLFGLRSERRIIHAELIDEVARGTLSAAELALLESFWRRQLGYVGLLLRGQVSRCLDLAAVHNRQVQLALFKRQASRASTTQSREALAGQIATVRAALDRARGVVAGLLLLGLLVRPAALAESQASQVRWNSLPELLQAGARDIGDYWARTLGPRYQPPSAVEAYSAQSACRFRRNNAVYCGPSRSIYYDQSFLQALWKDIGDNAPRFVLAHEWGHLVQGLPGVMTGARLFQIQSELQADCLAGQYNRNATSRHVLDGGDEDEAVRSLRKGRDEVDYPWFAPDAHGTGGQRVDAFQEGLDGRPCEGADFWRRVHVDPATATRPATPAVGALSLVCSRGEFVRKEVQRLPGLIQDHVTDALKGYYRSPDGAEVMVIVVATTSAEAATATFRGLGKTLRDSTFRSIGEGPVKDGVIETGRWERFQGRTEIVLMQNRQLLEWVEGPLGLPWKYETSAAGNCQT